MRTTVALLAAAVASFGCAQGFSPAPTPEVIASMPDTIPCSTPVVVDASSSRKAVDAEYRWLKAFYPKHSLQGQALLFDGDRILDVLTFRRADGRPASVCFDVTKARRP